jgi:hypothetical protein
MVGQMLIRKFPDLMFKNLSKFDEQITANRHKNLRCLIALWTIGQGGFQNLQYGLKSINLKLIKLFLNKNISSIN